MHETDQQTRDRPAQHHDAPHIQPHTSCPRGCPPLDRRLGRPAEEHQRPIQHGRQCPPPILVKRQKCPGSRGRWQGARLRDQVKRQQRMKPLHPDVVAKGQQPPKTAPANHHTPCLDQKLPYEWSPRIEGVVRHVIVVGECARHERDTEQDDEDVPPLLVEAKVPHHGSRADARRKYHADRLLPWKGGIPGLFERLVLDERDADERADQRRHEVDPRQDLNGKHRLDVACHPHPPWLGFTTGPGRTVVRHLPLERVSTANHTLSGSCPDALDSSSSRMTGDVDDG
mmetsp:Transcript_13105/g.37809  ORF Transcript_13105/g.37809 Transcript_13105/m.37809 type:complete len:285 (-) Transcript_13105:2356-3210(-)